ncbi:hypothetical protein Lser_V15G03151 [Lactuca serriola]
MLRGRFLLVSGDRKSTVKVHNVVRAVGISVASRLESNTGQFSGMVIHEDKWPRGMTYGNYNAISVVSNELFELPSRGLDFRKLELIQVACPKLSVKKLNTIDIYVLCMDCKMENIGDIMTDEFLNLEILSFGNCDINELPMEIRKLSNLRLLDMSGCRWLERISPGVISSLSQLEELDTGSKWWGDEEEGDASLTELDSLTNLKYLGIRIKSSSFLPNYNLFENLQRYVISVGVHLQKRRSFNNRMLLLKLESTDTHLGGGIEKLLTNNTEKVFLTGDGIKLALKELDPVGFQQVKNLTVESCNSEGIEYLSNYSNTSNGTGVFNNLEKLRMDKIWHLKGIFRYNGKGLPIRSFSKLRKIHLSVLPEMTHLFTYSVANNLEHLERLHIEYCNSMHEVILNQIPSALESTIDNKIVFPKLTELILNDVASLICFSHGINLQVEFPQLRVLKLEYLQNFHTFCPEEINLASEGNHRGTNFRSLVNHKWLASQSRSSGSSFQESGVSKVEFSSLAELTITKMGNIKHVWCGHLPDLVHLQGLYIQFCHMMEEVISVQRPSITTMEERIVFLKLKEVIIFGLNKLTFFCKGIDHVEFPQLRVLRLRWLTHFRNFCPEETTGRTSSLFNDKVSFPCLETLEVSELDSVEQLWSSELPMSQFGKLKSLRVEKCHKLVNIFPSDLQTVFPSLEKLEVEKCDSLEQVWGSTEEQIRKLKSIFVHECPMLTNLCSFYTFKGLSNLQILNISSCKMLEEVVGYEHTYGKMKEVLSLNKLEELSLAFLPNLSYFSHNKCDIELPELTHVNIKSCQEIYTFSKSSVTTPKLKYVVVDDVRRWLGDDDLNSTMRHFA